MNRITVLARIVTIILLPAIVTSCDDKPSANSTESDTANTEQQSQMTSNVKPPIAIWMTPNGTEYRILSIGELFFTDEQKRMLTIRFLSKDPKDEVVREKEFSDLYVLAAQNLNHDGFDMVGLEAVDKPPKKFGIQKVSGYRDNKTVDEVKELAEKKAGIP